jgi:hypothetical protein
MTLTIVQIFLSLIAGVGLFLMWRQVAAASRAVAWLVTAGVLIRAIGGQVAFWISYLHLPVARALQLGDGFWIFGLDGMTYFQQATVVARSGPIGILSVDPGVGSAFYVQTLATVILLLGAIAATGLLLNIAAYLGCCLIALSFGDPAEHRVVVFSIGVLSLAPSTVMWSLQPMKDTWFLFLVASFFGAARVWQQLWSGKNVSRRAVWWTLAMIATLYGISGIRWYFGFVAAMACLPFFALTVLQTSRRAVAAVAAAGLVPLLLAAVVLGSGLYISPMLRAFPLAQETPVPALSRALFKYVDDARSGFDRTGGATIIGAGHAISEVDAILGKHELRVAPIRPDQRTSAAKPPCLPAAVAVAESRNPAPTPARRKSAAVTRVARPKILRAPAPAPAPAPVTPAVAPHAVTPPSAAAAKCVPTVAQVDVDGAVTAGTVAMPASRVARILAGMAAMILPRTIAQGLGILDVRGGRGLWFFVELDTIAFDVVGISCVISIIGAIRRRELRAPVFWLILTVTVVVGGLLAYTVSNFGTLFRHREMVLLGLLLLPLAALPAKSQVPVPVREDARDIVRDVPDAVQSV